MPTPPIWPLARLIRRAWRGAVAGLGASTTQQWLADGLPPLRQMPVALCTALGWQALPAARPASLLRPRCRSARCYCPSACAGHQAARLRFVRHLPGAVRMGVLAPESQDALHRAARRFAAVAA